VPFDKGGKGRFIPMFKEAPKQLSIGQSSSILQKHCPAKVLDDLAHRVGRQVLSFVGATVALYPYYYPLKAV
jgi:hypothetical protein